MAGKKGSMSDFLKIDGKSLSGKSSWGPGNRVWEKLNARATGRNPPKSMSGSTSVPAPKPKVAAPKAPAVAAPAPKRYMSGASQPELSKVLSRPLEAQRSSRATMDAAAKRRFEAVRKSRGGK